MKNLTLGSFASLAPKAPRANASLGLGSPRKTALKFSNTSQFTGSFIESENKGGFPEPGDINLSTRGLNFSSMHSDRLSVFAKITYSDKATTPNLSALTAGYT